MPGLRLAASAELGWRRKGVGLLEAEAEWPATWTVGAPWAFLLGDGFDRAPAEESELRG